MKKLISELRLGKNFPENVVDQVINLISEKSYFENYIKSEDMG